MRGVVVALATAPSASLAHAEPLTFFHVLFAMAVVVGLAQFAGGLFVKVRQPAVVGEMLVGLALGPSLLGRVAPGIAEFVVPGNVAAHLRVVAQLGVVLFMFLVGLELHTGGLRKQAGSALAISLSGIVVPLAIGTAAAVGLYERLAPRGVGELVFVAFFAVAMSVTAFPVLARIVAERNLQNSSLGILALTCAAMDDLCAWCLLAIVASLAGGSEGHGLLTLGLASSYVVVMLLVARPLIERLSARVDREGAISRGTTAQMFLLVLLSSLATEWIGIHALFGAFLLGAIVPAEGLVAKSLRAKLEDLVSMVLLPVFFAFTGLRTDLRLVSGEASWLVCLLIVVLAFTGKLGGVMLTARMLGVGWRRAAALGALMNTRGLMELVVLNVGLDLGIISRPLFAMMVVMALVTTCAAGPLLDWLGLSETAGAAESGAEAPQPAS